MRRNTTIDGSPKSATARLLLLVIGLTGADIVAADLFLLGDYTPIYALTSLPPHHGEHRGRGIVKGNQELFLRFGGNVELPGVVLRFSGDVRDAALAELDYFYGLNNYRVDHADSSTFTELVADTNLLLLGNPDWSWDASETKAISDLLARGGNVVLVVEPDVCTNECRESSTRLLENLGSSLRIGPHSESCCGGLQWGMLADHPFMIGIGPVTYGATFSVKGGSELIYNADGLSILSVDHMESPEQTHAGMVR